MKLSKNKAITSVATFVSALLVAGMCFSAQIDKEAISTRCEMVYNTLDKMFEEQKHERCAYEVKYAGWMMQGSAALVRAERYPDALKSLRIAEEKLSIIYVKHKQCPRLSRQVIPSLKEVNSLINELENTSN